jgi:hypothetical protein
MNLFERMPVWANILSMMLLIIITVLLIVIIYKI